MSNSVKTSLPREVVEIINKLREVYSRPKIDPIEEANLLNVLVGEPADKSRRPYLTVTEVSKEFGISRGKVYLKTSLLNLIPELRQLVSEGKLGLWRAREFARKTPEEQMKSYKSLQSKKAKAA